MTPRAREGIASGPDGHATPNRGAQFFDLTLDDDEEAFPNPHRLREAERIKIGPWPGNVPTYTNWRLAVVDEVVAASSRPDEAFTWISAVRESATMDELQKANFPFSRPMGFETLDAKLSSALSSIITGDFARKIHVLKMKAMETGKRVSGRQLLKAVDEHFRLTEADGAVFGMERLLSVSMKKTTVSSASSPTGTRS